MYFIYGRYTHSACGVDAAYNNNCAIPPSAIGIIRLSKSFRGSTSINMPDAAIISDASAFLLTQKDEMKTAVKQVRLPATVFPFVRRSEEHTSELQSPDHLV